MSILELRVYNKSKCGWQPQKLVQRQDGAPSSWVPSPIAGHAVLGRQVVSRSSAPVDDRDRISGPLTTAMRPKPCQTVSHPEGPKASRSFGTAA